MYEEEGHFTNPTSPIFLSGLGGTESNQGVSFLGVQMY